MAKSKKRSISKAKWVRDMVQRTSHYYEANKDFQNFAVWKIILQKDKNLLPVEPASSNQFTSSALTENLSENQLKRT